LLDQQKKPQELDLSLGHVQKEQRKPEINLKKKDLLFLKDKKQFKNKLLLLRKHKKKPKRKAQI